MFLSRLCTDDDPQPDVWVIAQPLIWEDQVFGRLEIPAGFRTDLASIPRVFRNIQFLDPNGLSRRPAAMHDWLYAWRGIGKDDADEFLKQSLLAEGAAPHVSEVFYLGVHVFGQQSWDSDNGALETRDFDTPAHYAAWQASITSPQSKGTNP